MVFRLATQELEDGTMPEFFHELPVLNDPFTDQILEGMGGCVVVGLVADVEIKMVIFKLCSASFILKFKFV